MFDYQIGRDALGIDNKLVFTEKNFFARKIFCIDQGTGQKYWELDVSEIGQTVSNGKEAKGKIVGSLITKNEELLVAISNSKLIKIANATGGTAGFRPGGLKSKERALEKINAPAGASKA